MISAIEDHLIEETKALFGNRLKTVDSLPGDWSEDMLHQLLITAPAVYFAFLGGPKLQYADEPGGIDGKWVAFAITAHASGQAARRRGDSREIGAYEIVQRLVPRLHNHVIEDVGTLKLGSIENLYSGTLDRRGVSIYAVQFGIPVYFEAEQEANLDDFAEVHVDFDLAPKDGTIEGKTDIQLP